MTKTEPINFPAPVSAEDVEFMNETTYCRLTSTIEYPAEASTADLMNLAEASGALDFWNDQAEDVYNEHGDGL